MSNYNQQELDFVIRTQKIIEQYDKCSIPESEKFEVTLFINCLVGLLIVPKERWYENLPKTKVSENEWGIDPSSISIKKGHKKDVKTIACHLRNSVSHYRFKVFDASADNIMDIEFKDCDKAEVETFRTVISVENLRRFTAKLTKEFVSAMKIEV